MKWALKLLQKCHKTGGRPPCEIGDEAGAAVSRRNWKALKTLAGRQAWWASHPQLVEGWGWRHELGRRPGWRRPRASLRGAERLQRGFRREKRAERNRWDVETSYKLCALRERSLNHQLHTITHIDLISMQNKMIQTFEPRFLSLSELFEYAKKIGIALPEERHLLPIARWHHSSYVIHKDLGSKLYQAKHLRGKKQQDDARLLFDREGLLAGLPEGWKPW